jgi:hypothetical protein
MRRARYDRVILASQDGGDGYEELRHLIDCFEAWSFDWSDPIANAESYRRDGFEPEQFIEVTGHHRWAYLYPWVRDLKGSQVSVAGGIDGSCLLDLEDSLRHLGIRYRRIESCIF